MNRHCKDRPGFTLVEMMVVITLSSLLGMISVMLFSALLKSQRQFSQRERQRRELARIDAILRSDTHAASMVAAQNGETCELKNAAGETWTYRRADDNLQRVRSNAGKVVQRESFRLQAGTKVEFQVSSEGKRTWLAVNLEPPAVTAWHGKFLIGGLVAKAAEESP